MTATVLVVDDVEANLKLLEARLTADYFEVRTARNGQEALDVCAQERTDVVLLDVMMPCMDGFEVCRRLKSDPRTQHLPVIIITALDQPSDKVRGLEAGADDFLTKPVDDVALITRVRNLARLRRDTVLRRRPGERAQADRERWRCRDRTAKRHPLTHPETRRPGALLCQARWTEPRGSRRRLNGEVSSTAATS